MFNNHDLRIDQNNLEYDFCHNRAGLSTSAVFVCGVTSLPSLDVSRLTPKNVHQRPTVVILCGPHIQGAQGISCGRHLANHEVEVILFLPNFVKMQESVTSEVQLYSRTSSKQVSSVKGRTHQQVFRSTQDVVTLMDRSMLQLYGLTCVQSDGGECEHD